MTSITILPTTLSMNLNQTTPHYSPEPYYLKDTKAKLDFPEKFIKQRNNTNYDITDFLPTPLLGPNVKRRQDNHVKIWIDQETRIIDNGSKFK